MDAGFPKDHAPTKKLDHDPIQFDRIMVQSAGLVVEVSEIIIHEADEPNVVADLFDADALADGLSGNNRRSRGARTCASVAGRCCGVDDAGASGEQRDTGGDQHDARRDRRRKSVRQTNYSEALRVGTRPDYHVLRLKGS